MLIGIMGTVITGVMGVAIIGDGMVGTIVTIATIGIMDAVGNVGISFGTFC
jgi:hypothetical protein